MVGSATKKSRSCDAPHDQHGRKKKYARSDSLVVVMVVAVVFP